MSPSTQPTTPSMLPDSKVYLLRIQKLLPAGLKETPLACFSVAVALDMHSSSVLLPAVPFKSSLVSSTQQLTTMSHRTCTTYHEITGLLTTILHSYRESSREHHIFQIHLDVYNTACSACKYVITPTYPCTLLHVHYCTQHMYMKTSHEKWACYKIKHCTTLLHPHRPRASWLESC